MLGASPLLGQALQNAWDRSALGTGPPKCLGQALLNAWDRPALGTGPLGEDRIVGRNGDGVGVDYFIE